MPEAQRRVLLTVREAATALAISERTLWELTHRGGLPCVRIGRSVRYVQADLDAWIAAQRVQHTSSGGRKDT
jgi:excisionase family DNA binding protein